MKQSGSGRLDSGRSELAFRVEWQRGFDEGDIIDPPGSESYRRVLLAWRRDGSPLPIAEYLDIRNSIATVPERTGPAMAIPARVLRESATLKHL